MLNVLLFIKKYKKAIGIILGILLIIYLTLFITNKVSEAKSAKLYEQLENRYSNLEESYNKLGELYSELKGNDKLLREQLGEANKDIRKANIIVGDFEEAIGSTKDTIERIEITVGFIDKLVEQLPDEIILLEENNSGS